MPGRHQFMVFAIVSFIDFHLFQRLKWTKVPGGAPRRFIAEICRIFGKTKMTTFITEDILG